MTIKETEITQIKRYANAILDDARFDKSKVRWKFYLLGNKLDGLARRESDQEGRESGILSLYENATIYVKTWASVIEDVKWKYDIYYKDLIEEITNDDTHSYLQENYSHLLPFAKPKKKRGKSKASPKRAKKSS